MQAVIMAGGSGTRLQPIAKDIPKPMVPIDGKPILEYQIESLKKSGITDITLIVGHLGDVVKDFFQDGSKWGTKITYVTEMVPLGTAGALYYLKDVITEDFILLFGDLILDIDWNRFMSFHKQHGGMIMLYGHPNAHPYDSDVLLVDKDSRVTGIDSKNNVRDYFYHNFVNAGVYCISPKVLEGMDELVKIDLEKKIIANQVKNGTVFAYRSTEYVKDMGTPDRLQSVVEDVTNGVVEAKSLRNKQKAIFLDRDGTINVLHGFLNTPERFELETGVAEAVGKINRSGYLAIVATNQPVIARGECTIERLDQIHAKMETLLGKEGAYLDDIFFCPHHPDIGFEGEVSELKIPCDCRKPKIGMMKQAEEKYNIDLASSWYVGDSTMDIQTGINAGMKTVLLRTGEAGKDGKFNATPDHVSDDLGDAVEYILAQN